MNIEEKDIIHEIFQSEAKAILQDLIPNTILIQYFKTTDMEKISKSIKYIKNIFEELYETNILKIEVFHVNEILYGYTFYFIYPEYKYIYLHKIFIYPEYRKQGIGKRMLENIHENNKLYNISLVCPNNKVDFYTNKGFNFIQNFTLPKTNKFILSENLYKGLSLMSNSTQENKCIIFLLDDIDINNIINIIK